MRILLFDIDGTLLTTNGGGKRAFELAIGDVFGVQNADTNLDFAGRTDRALLSELLVRNRIPSTESNQQLLLQRYTQHFPNILAERGGCVLPGVTELLRQLSNQSGLRCFAMTGNLRETAMIKLRHFGLLGFFQEIFGGDHDSNRDALARRTAASIGDHYGEQALRDLIVIGDTPHDIRCGRAIGARVIAVCTGTFCRADLEIEQPFSVHDDFSDVSAIHRLLT